MPIDILAGSPTLRQQIESQVPLADIVASWRPGVAEFEEIRRNYLLYCGLERIADRRIELPIAELVRREQA